MRQQNKGQSGNYKRSRLIYAALIVITIILGLASRKFPDLFPQLIQPYIGDMLWALMVYFLFAFLLPSSKPLYIACFALAFSFSIELSQLYHAPWIDDIRQTILGGLVLGFGFLWSDLVCYMIGIAAGFMIENSLFKPAAFAKVP